MCGNAEVTTHPEYFRATLRIMPRWLDQSPDRRHHSILHEIGHIHHACGHQMSVAIIEKNIPQGAARDTALEVLMREFEKDAETFAIMIELLEGVKS